MRDEVGAVVWPGTEGVARLGCPAHGGDQGADWPVQGDADTQSPKRFGRTDVTLSAECCTDRTAYRIVQEPAALVRLRIPGPPTAQSSSASTANGLTFRGSARGPTRSS